MAESRHSTRSGCRYNEDPSDLDVLLQGLKLEGCASYGLPTGVGLVYDERMLAHKCLWLEAFPEKPERLQLSLDTCQKYGLLDRCVPVDPRFATEGEILRLHSKELLDLVKKSATMNEDELKELSTRFDAVYFNQKTYEAAMLAAGSVIEIVDQIISNKIRYGMALVRPPGHHAMHHESNGYCIFNNAALAARHALDVLGLERILMVDWDVHHGQGIQYSFYDDPRVLYFSIHRYEYGMYWPNLRQSDYDCIGSGNGRGFNINVPFNEVGMTNGDYMAIMQQILMPVAYEYTHRHSSPWDAMFVGCKNVRLMGPMNVETSMAKISPVLMTIFDIVLVASLECCCEKLQRQPLPVGHDPFQPQLVIVSSGYDAAIGDPEGRSEVTPAAYAHFTHMMKQLANGKLAVVFEGGYCLKSLAEGVALTLRCLLDDPCPALGPLSPPMESTVQSILHAIRVLRPYWQCFAYHQDAVGEESLPPMFRNIEMPKKGVEFSSHESYQGKYNFEESLIPFNAVSKDETADLDKRIDRLIEETCLVVPPNRLSSSFVAAVVGPALKRCGGHVEDPTRITRIYSLMEEYGILSRCKLLESRHASKKEIALVHSGDYINEAERWTDATNEELAKTECQLDSIYLSQDTFSAATLAVGCTLQMIDEIMTGKSVNGMAVVRPPGHHAEASCARGFCIFNNVAIAAKYAQTKYNVNRILIVDWDVHHGNGIQDCFEQDPSVLYISLHRLDIYPNMNGKKAKFVGIGSGKGFNINIPWKKGGMGDADYIAAFQQIIMPVAYEFGPELVLVSSGFDAAMGDPLGRCRITPVGYAHMTHMLSSLAGGKIALVLEGGYNLSAISESAAACVAVLLGDRVPALEGRQLPDPTAVATICQVLDLHAPYWKCLNPRVQMPSRKQTLLWLGDTIPSSNERANKILDKDLSPRDKKKRLSSSSSSSSADDAAGAVGGASVVNVHPTTSLHDALQQLAPGQDKIELFAVEPLPYCPHLTQAQPLPDAGLDTSAACGGCESVNENWVCLTCYEVHCSRYVNGHMEAHSIESEHPMVLSYADLSVWCYMCNAYVHHDILSAAKRAAHESKFGFAPPVRDN